MGTSAATFDVTNFGQTVMTISVSIVERCNSLSSAFLISINGSTSVVIGVLISE